MKLDTTLYLVTDSTGYSESDFLYKVESACRGGVTLVQLREKEREGREFYRLACRVKKITETYDIPLLIDDRVDIAMAVDAAGVHLGQQDLPVFAARKMLIKNKIIGATAKTAEQAKEAYEQGADYLGIGAIYPTSTKVRTVRTSIDTLDAICRCVPIPVNAIGGLNKENLSILHSVPVSGICVVSAIMKADDPEKAARELKEAFFQCRQY